MGTEVRACQESVLIDGGDDLVMLLEQQCDLYRQLKRLTERQRSLIDRADAEPLLALLGERQKVVDQLTRLDSRLARAKQEWMRLHASVPAQAREHVERLVLELRELLGEILEADQRDSEQLSARKASLQSALTSVQAGKQAHAAYAPAPPDRSQYVDRTDEET